MSAQLTYKPLQCFVSAVTVLALVGVCIAPMTFAAITSPTINPLAIVTDNGRHLIVSGPVVCTESETVELRVQVTQRAMRVVAEGRPASPAPVPPSTGTSMPRYKATRPFGKGRQMLSLSVGQARVEYPLTRISGWSISRWQESKALVLEL